MVCREDTDEMRPRSDFQSINSLHSNPLFVRSLPVFHQGLSSGRQRQIRSDADLLSRDLPKRYLPNRDLPCRDLPSRVQASPQRVRRIDMTECRENEDSFHGGVYYFTFLHVRQPTN